ncbi:MAG: putative phosphoribosyl transferase [Actinomycetota bacterium]|jgi:predicted phosphoribosyltransferase|nr:putative phosphoribosyl transferase [Actinomycetota bacterium]
MTFDNRPDAGERLAPMLARRRLRDPIVLGLPRGGVPVAAIVADALGVPLDVIIVRKLGAPSQPEYAIGALGEDGVRVIDETAMRSVGVDVDELASIERAERQEVERRATLFRAGRSRLDLAGRTAVIVDDGVATGATAAAACRVARALGATVVVLAVPVAPADWTTTLAGEADGLIAVETHSPFYAVGFWYTDFRQTTDDEVVALLAARPPGR